DAKASRQHLRVKKQNGDYYVENLSDTNPVLVNGRPVTEPTLLHADDQVTIGTTVFGFYPEGAPEAYAFEAEGIFEGEEFTREKLIEKEEEPEKKPEEAAIEEAEEEIPAEAFEEEMPFEEPRPWAELEREFETAAEAPLKKAKVAKGFARE